VVCSEYVYITFIPFLPVISFLPVHFFADLDPSSNPESIFLRRPNYSGTQHQTAQLKVSPEPPNCNRVHGLSKSHNRFFFAAKSLLIDSSQLTVVQKPHRKCHVKQTEMSFSESLFHGKPRRSVRSCRHKKCSKRNIIRHYLESGCYKPCPKRVQRYRIFSHRLGGGHRWHSSTGDPLLRSHKGAVVVYHVAKMKPTPTGVC